MAEEQKPENIDRREQIIESIEQLVSKDALVALDKFCENRPDIAESVRQEAKKTVEILSDFTLDHALDPQWVCMYDAVLLQPILEDKELSTALLNDYNPEHRVLTLSVLSDMRATEEGLDALRSENEEIADKINNGLVSRWGMTPIAFKNKFEFADPRDIDRKLGDRICPHAAFGYASRLLYRLNRSPEYSDERVLKDIIDAETIFVPLFDMGRDAFSIALEDSAEIARMRRCGRLGELDKAKYILGETYGEIKQGLHKKALEQLFGGVVAQHVDKDGVIREGLSIRSAVGHLSGEHSVAFYAMTGEIDGVKVRGRARAKGLASTFQKLQSKEYKDINIRDATTWPQDLFGTVLITGEKIEDESSQVDMAAEERNVRGVAKILRYLATYIGLESTAELRFQASASREHAVHIRGDKLYIEGITRDSGFTPQTADIHNNDDHSYQVSKLTVGVSVSDRSTPINTEVQLMTRRARKNSRENDSAHWLLKKANAIKRRRDPNQTLPKHHDVLTSSQRLLGAAYLEKNKQWLRSGVATNYLTFYGAREFCEDRGVVF